jgi:hypothetical protein
MKVITQLIQHFWQRRVLTTEQVDYLVRQGFVRPGDLPGLDWSEDTGEEIAAPAVVFLAPDPLDEVAEKLTQRTAGRRGPGKPKGKVLAEDELVAAVETVLTERADALAAFRAWAARFGAAADWPGAAAAARRVPAEHFTAVLADGLRRGAAALRDLWAALDVEPLHAVADGPELRGPAVRAYRLLLAADRPLPPRHCFLLRHPPLQTARAVAELYRRLLAALASLRERQPRLLAAALRADAPAAPFWALALVYNARREPPGGPVMWGREYGPLPPPAAAVWRAAWSAALVMDPPAVTRLLAACYADEETRAAPEPLHCTYPLYCPRVWRAPAV